MRPVKMTLLLTACGALLTPGCKDTAKPAEEGASAPAPAAATGGAPEADPATGSKVPAAVIPSAAKAAPPSVPPSAPVSAPTRPPAPAKAPAAAQRIAAAGVSFEAPSAWLRQRPRLRMRLAQFKLPRAEGDAKDGTLTVIAAGGTAEANIARWKGQFDGEPEVKQTARQLGGMDAVLVEMSGTFLFKARPMMPGPGTPMPNTLMLGAIVKTPQAQLFFKGWGPSETMAQARPHFLKMLESLSSDR